MRKEGTMSTCYVCGEEFYLPPSHRTGKDSCSRTCRAKAQSEWQRKDLATRFWAKVDKSGECWLWTGAILATGYGSIRINSKAVRAHRAAYEMVNGPIPKGTLLRHTCDNRRCVKPDHLLLGSHKDNTADAIERGQHATGERSVLAILSNDAVATIKAALAAGVPGRYLANQFGVSESAISKIKHGKKRRHG
jgi:hypothetical protein